MRSVYDADGIRIVEDVLSEPELWAVQSWAEQVTYQGVHHERWRPVWRIGGGEPLRGPTWSIFAVACPPEDQRAEQSCPPPVASLAAVLRRLLLSGRPGGDRVSITPWIYPCGTALGLHRDDGNFEGSYIFYTVPDWDVHWGGLLHCVTETADADMPPRAILDATAERVSVTAIGRGIWIAPVRNRLVMLAPQVRHFISRIDPNAGDRPRTTIAGFIHRAARLRRHSFRWSSAVRQNSRGAPWIPKKTLTK